MNNFFYIHSDFFKYFFFLQKKIHKITINKACKIMHKELLEISNNRIIVPTFNYNFPKTKKYNYFTDKSQVGFFSEYFRKLYKKNRTYVPMFSECSNIKIKKYYSKKINIFGKKSLYHDLSKNNSKLVFFGAEFAPSYIMYIENLYKKKINYRKIKRFHGNIVFGNSKKNVSIIYNCRPLGINFSYDLKKIELDLKKNSILLNKKTKLGFTYKILNIRQFKKFCLKKLKIDKYYFLKKHTKNKIIQIIKKKKLEEYI